jgi:D-tyrosyl-tRNA(Tyr) deacylase
MLAVVQRVREASVTVDGVRVGAVGTGLCVLLGVERGDTPAAAAAMAAKLAKLRIFADHEGKMNLALGDVGGGVLLISQFTLAGDVSGGNRPSFLDAAPPEDAEPLYGVVAERLARDHGLPVATGRFRTAMQVTIVNEGPVTILVRIGADGRAVGTVRG